MTSPSFDQYLRLSPEEQARQDDLYWQRLTDPEHVAFLAGLLRMSLRAMERSHRCRAAAEVRPRRVHQLVCGGDPIGWGGEFSCPNSALCSYERMRYLRRLLATFLRRRPAHRQLELPLWTTPKRR
jgi:hypothetical protein